MEDIRAAISDYHSTEKQLREKLMSGAEFENSKFVFLGSPHHVPSSISEGLARGEEINLVAVEGCMSIIDTTEGALIEGDYFTLVPRKDAAAAMAGGKGGGTGMSAIFESMVALEKSQKSSARTGSKGKLVVMDGDKSNYVTIGTYPKRVGKGSAQTVKALGKKQALAQRKIFDKWFRRVEHCADKHIPSHMRRLLQLIEEMCPHQNLPFEDGRYSKIWPAMAVGRNVCLSCHTDEDYFWSMVTVVASDELCKDEKRIICYFCFPTLGLAVALRAGDILMFNPRIPHCVSSRCDGSYDAFCISMYVKTLLVSGKDNHQVLSAEELQLAEYTRRLKATKGEQDVK